MKKYYYICSFVFILISNVVKSQFCEDCQTVAECFYGEDGGYCPSSIPDAIVNEYYDLYLTCNAPASGEYSEGNRIKINYINVIAVEGLPEGIYWCKSSDKFVHNELGCVHLWGTPTKIGEYPLTVRVKVVALGGLLQIEREDHYLKLIIKESSAPGVKFTVNNSSSTINTNIEFTNLTNISDTCSLQLINWLWEFENGSPATSTLMHPIVRWEKSGYYSTSLTATNNNGSKKLIKHNYITIKDTNNNIPPQAYINSNKRVAVVKENITFFGTSTDSLLIWIDKDDNNSINQLFGYACNERPNSYEWTFEGGTPAQSSEKNPIVFWENQGVYKVSLKVSNNNGNDSLSISNYIAINNIDNVKIYPTPAEQYVVIEAPDMQKINIFDINGRLLISLKSEPTHQEIDIKKLRAGVYLAEIVQITGNKKAAYFIVR